MTADRRHRLVSTPVGELALLAERGRLVATSWVDDADRLLAGSIVDPTMQARVAQRLTRYFEGATVAFDDLPTPSGSPFHERCWAACRTIRPGETWSYARLAREAGSPAAARAAGQAMRSNPLPVIIPCHRVISSSGELHGYAGSTRADGPSIARKRYLLDLDRRSGVLNCSGPPCTADSDERTSAWSLVAD